MEEKHEVFWKYGKYEMMRFNLLWGSQQDCFWKFGRLEWILRWGLEQLKLDTQYIIIYYHIKKK